MKKQVLKIGIGFLIPLTGAWASFEADDGASSKQVRSFPLVMRTGLDLPSDVSGRAQRRRQAWEATRDAFEKQLISEMVDAAPTTAPERVEKFTEQMEIIPEAAKGLLPGTLGRILEKKISLVRSNNRGQDAPVTVSVARFLNDVSPLQGDEGDLELSIYFGRVGFALKDATMEGVSTQTMRSMAAHCFMTSGQKAEKAVSDFDDLSALSDGYLSAAQSYYWAGCLSNTPKTQGFLMAKAQALREKGALYLESAPYDMRYELRNTNEGLEKKITFSQSYLETKAKFPSIPSLYEWNRGLSLMSKGVLASLKAAA